MKLTNAAIGLVLAVLIIGGGVLLLSDDGEQMATMPNQPETSQTQDEPTQDTSDQQFDREIQIDMSNFEFSQKQIQAAPGETLKIVATSVGGVHDFVVDEFGAATAIANNGETVETIFTIPEDFLGTAEFYCSVGNHRELGMVGEIVVSGI